MVLKCGKFGVRSGNTFKCRSKYMVSSATMKRTYRSQSFLVRQFIKANYRDSFDDHDSLPESEIVKEDNIMYSLNKKKRWNLPELIKQDILEGDHEGEHYGIQLIERHNLCRVHNCVGVYSTKGALKEVKCNGYMNPTSVLNAYTGGKNRLKRKRRKEQKINRKRQTLSRTVDQLIALDDEEDKRYHKPSSQVRYEVYMPSSETSSVTHNPKFVGHYEPKVPKKYGKQRHRRGMGSAIDEALASTEIYFDNHTEYDLFYGAREEAFATERKNTFLFEEALQHAEHVGKSATNVYNDSANIMDTDGTTEIGRPPIFEPVSVFLSVEQIDPQLLRHCYGNKYFECDCFPRTFIIDISEELSNTVQRFNIRGTRKSNVVLIFVHDVANEMNTMKEDVYRVTLNAVVKEGTSQLKIETLFDYMETNIDDIITNTLFFIETLTPETIVREERVRTITHEPTPSVVDEILNWQTHSYYPHETFVFKDFVGEKEDTTEAADDGFHVVSLFDSYKDDMAVNVTSPSGRVCDICFNFLGVERPGTCLISCSHWFCNECWTDYLDSGVKSGAITLTCPEFKCKGVVDAGTVLSLLPMRLILKYAKYRHSNEIERQETTRWCPNERCGRVLRAKTDTVSTGQCKCGEKLCFKCVDKAHWPAPCKNVIEYKEGLKIMGNPEELEVFNIFGKNCPWCKLFVTKDGGCENMVCFCGNHFCWTCGDKHTENDGEKHVDCGTYGYEDDYDTSAKELNPIEAFVSRLAETDKWYGDAVEYRRNNKPAKVKVIKSNVKAIGKTLKCYIFRSMLKGETVSLDFEYPYVTREEDKVYAFLNNTVRLYLETNYLLEYTTVLVNTKWIKADCYLALKKMIGRLSRISDAVYMHLADNDPKDPRRFIADLTELRRHNIGIIQKLVECVSMVTMDVTSVRQNTLGIEHHFKK